MTAKSNSSGRARNHPVEQLERRIHLSAAAPTVSAAAASATVTLKYAGTTNVMFSGPHGVLNEVDAAVQVTPAVTGGPSPAGLVTFQLNGRPAGFSYATFDGDEATFEANPGTYTLTAHFDGDQTYAPADLPPTVITVPAGAATGAPFLSAVDDQPPAVVNAGAALISSFTIGLNAQGDSSGGLNDTVDVSVSAVNEADPNTLIPLQSVSEAVTYAGPQTSAAFAVDAPTTGLAAGTYQMVYDVGVTSSVATIYSLAPFTVAAAATPPSAAGLPTVAGLGGTAAPVPVAAGVRSRGVTATVDVPTGLAGTDTVAVYASETGAIDAASVLLGTVRKRVAVKRGATTVTVTVPVQTAAAPAGTYVLMARVTGGPAGAPPTDAAVGPVLAVQPPASQLRATVADVVPTKAFRVGSPLAFTLTLTNVGNVAATGRATVVVSLAGNFAGAQDVPVRTLAQALTVRPGRPVQLRVTGRVPAAAVAAAAYAGDLGVQVRVTLGAGIADVEQTVYEPVVGKA